MVSWFGAKLKKGDGTPHRDQHDQDETKQTKQGCSKYRPASGRMHHPGEDGQQQPGSYIVNRSAGDCHCSQRGGEQLPFLQNPGQHRESCDAHRRSHKKSERQKRNLRSRHFRIQESSKTDAQRQRRQDAYITGEHHGQPLPQDELEIHLQSYSKHKQQQPKIAQNGECWQR